LDAETSLDRDKKQEWQRGNRFVISEFELPLLADAVMAKNLKAAGHKSQHTAAPLIPPRPTIASLRTAASTCKVCDLWKRATQTVFGEGGEHAKVVFGGEQPGDREDLAGHPFVGPRRTIACEKRCLCHECGEAFQLGAGSARKATYPQEAALLGNQCLPPLARCRAESDQAGSLGVPWCYRRAGFVRKRFQRYAAARVSKAA
jgi:hypothetical protein